MERTEIKKNIMKNTYAAFLRYESCDMRNNIEMWTGSTIPCISLFCHQQTCTVIFIFFHVS